MKRLSLRALAYRLVSVVAVCTCSSAAKAGPRGWNDLVQGFGGPRDPDVIVEQLPTRSGGPASDTAFRDSVGRPMWAQIADNILLTQATSAGHLEWYGFYGAYQETHDPPTGDETMRVRFYATREADGLPGDILYEESFLNPSRTATGFTVLDAPEFLYSVDLSSPVVLDAETLYWLEVVQVGDLESHFRWEAGYGLVPQHATIWTLYPYWAYNTGSQAFRLSTVPEPSVLALLGFGIGLTATLRHRKEAAYTHLSKHRT